LFCIRHLDNTLRYSNIKSRVHMSFLSEVIRGYRAGRAAREAQEAYRAAKGQCDSFRRDPPPVPPTQEEPARDIARERAEWQARLATLLDEDARRRRASVREAYKVIGRALGLE
jgi:hypothetical protein